MAGRARRAQPLNPGSGEASRRRTARPAHRPPRLPGRAGPCRVSLGELRPPPPRPPERPQGCSRHSLLPRHGRAAPAGPAGPPGAGMLPGGAAGPHLRAGCRVRVPRPALTPAALPCCRCCRCHRRHRRSAPPCHFLSPRPAPAPATHRRALGGSGGNRTAGLGL